MKKSKLLILFIILFTISGCSSLKGETKRAYHISSKLIEYMHNDKVDTKSLTNYEREIFDKVIEENKYENATINISELGIIGLESYKEEDTSPEIYKENGDYKIKYSDIYFKEFNGEYVGFYSLNHKEVAIFKSLNPILYDDTNNSNYYFYYDFYKVYDDKIEFYYKNLANKGGLTIRFKINNKKISDVYFVYEDIYAHVDQKKGLVNNKILFRIIFGFFAIIGVSYILVMLYNKFRL